MVWVGCFVVVVVVVVVGAAVMVIFISLALLFTLPVARKGALLCVAWPVDRRKHVLSDDSAWCGEMPQMTIVHMV